jgi:hypothetical protein
MFIEVYLCWYIHEEPYVPHNTIVEMMVELYSSSTNVHEVVYDNSNPYRNMVMDAMRMNPGHASKFLIADEERNVDTTKIFYFLKDFDEPL